METDPSRVRLWSAADSEKHSHGYRTAFPSELEEMARPPTRAHMAPEPSLEHDAEALQRPTRARTAPVARHREPKRDNMGDTPMAEESEAQGTAGCAGSGGKHVECHCEHVSFLIDKYPKMGLDAIVQHLDRLDNQKDGLEEDIAGILGDQSEAERDMAELRAEQDRYREKLEITLQKQQRVVDSLLHLAEDMSGRLKRLEELKPLASGPELPPRLATAELVERVKTLRSAMEKHMGGPAEAPSRAVGAAHGCRGGGGASCLVVGRPGSGALPPPTTRPFGRAAGTHYSLAVTRHQPDRARSCQLALRAVGAAGGCLGGAPVAWASGIGRSPTPHRPSFGACGRGRVPLAWVRGVWGRALSHPRLVVLSGVLPRPTTHWLWVRGVRAWEPVVNSTAGALAVYCVMEAMVSCLIHGGNISHISQFQFLPSCRQGEDGPCGAMLMLTPMMPLCCVSFPCVVPCTMCLIDVILSCMIL